MSNRKGDNTRGQLRRRARQPVVNDLSDDLLMVLLNKLEAVAAYESYLKDCHDPGDTECQELVVELKADDERHMERLRQELERLMRAGKFH